MLSSRPDGLIRRTKNRPFANKKDRDHLVTNRGEGFQYRNCLSRSPGTGLRGLRMLPRFPDKHPRKRPLPGTVQFPEITNGSGQAPICSWRVQVGPSWWPKFCQRSSPGRHAAAPMGKKALLGFLTTLVNPRLEQRRKSMCACGGSGENT